MSQPTILASSGGFVSVPGLWNVSRPGGIMRRALQLTGKTRPRVLLVLTASGDARDYLTRMYAALTFDGNCDVRHLELFTQPNVPVEEALAWADVVWVGGGSTANMMAVWRVHGVDVAMRDAWERGVVLAGVSAGSICWHVGGPTDSFGAELKPVTDCLSLLPYGNGVHYDAEAQRRPLLHDLVGTGVLPLSYATDNGVGILYRGTEPVEVITDVEVDPLSGPAAYRVERTADGVVEQRLAPGAIN